MGPPRYSRRRRYDLRAFGLRFPARGYILVMSSGLGDGRQAGLAFGVIFAERALTGKTMASREVIVVGAGPAGLGAALAAAKRGAEVVLVESDGGIGGELFSGMPILGAYTSLGKPCVLGVLPEIIATCREIDAAGCIGPVCDWRSVVGLCLDPEVLRLAVCRLLEKYGVKLLLKTTVIAAEVQKRQARQLELCSPGKRFNLACQAVVDATGGGYLTRLCGGEVVFGSESGDFQPLSVTFRLNQVDFEAFLRFIRDHPEEALLSDNPVLEPDRRIAAARLCEAGFPYVALAARGRVLGEAIANGRMHPCTAAFITPTSVPRQEVCVNVTRVSGVDCRELGPASQAYYQLHAQVARSAAFLRTQVPGFAAASITAILPRLGIRESGRIVGDSCLTQEDAVQARRFPDAVARGCHHVDIHGSGTAQVRIPIRDGLAYDIPYRCLLPRGLANVIAAGRCLSSDRGANGSARVMGTCLATGQAAGIAAALLLQKGAADFRLLDTAEIIPGLL